MADSTLPVPMDLTPQQRLCMSLGDRVRAAVPDPAVPGQEQWCQTWNGGRQAVLDACVGTRDVLSLLGITSSERQTLIAIMNKAHQERSDLPGQRASEVTVIAHKLGLHRDA